ncbi:MAG: thiamine/thiamine pyrophosphate ABC transporter permease ThiP [Paracoccaceae bacterium]
MAGGAQQLTRGTVLWGGAASLGIGLMTLGTVAAVAWEAGLSTALSGAGWSAVRFTVMQALLSALLSVFFAVPLARALVRRRFPGRRLFVALLGAPFLLPVIVAVLGLLAVWGRAGYVSAASLALGGGRLDIYGLGGILLAHVFFNLPLVTRLLLQGWGAIPQAHFRLAAQIGFRPADTFRHLELPMLRAVLPGAFLLVFLLCMTSFAVALTLGGGPRATTIELAIYQAVRFDFDLSAAAGLALFQFSICALVGAVALTVAVSPGFGSDLDRRRRIWTAPAGVHLWCDRTAILAVAVFLLAPLAAVVLRGALPLLSGLPVQVWPALLRSLLTALASAALAFALALSLGGLIDGLRSRGLRVAGTIEGLGLLTLAASPFVMGTGLFILISPVFDPFSLSLAVTALTNAVMSLPFALRALLPALAAARRNYGRLAESLGMSGVSRFRLVTWPLVRRESGFALGLSAALSMGDLGIIALFAPPEGGTLPLVMRRLMAAYRMDDAAGTALLLLLSSLLLFWIFDRGGRLGRAF